MYNNSAINLSDFYRQMSYIADDETSMQKLFKYVQKLVKSCSKAKAEVVVDTYTPRTHDELVADFKEACREVKLNMEGKLVLPTWEEALNEL